MDNSHDISVLNGLIETTLDSVKGFSDAAEDTNAGTHAGFFSEMAQERSQVASRLQALVAGLGGDPEDDSSYGAAAHRGFMNLKGAIMGSSERAVIEEVERGEDYLKAKYETALQDGELAPETRQVIEEAYQSVRKGHDRASALKHSMAN
jgi:uncharacterized protein (TIGR02284 family)